MLKTLRLLITAPFRLIISLFNFPARKLSEFFHSVKILFTDKDIGDSPIGDVVAKTFEDPNGLIEHFHALRGHLLRTVIGVVLTTAASFAFIQNILAYLAIPLDGGLAAMQAIEVTESVGTVMKVTLLCGITLGFPYIAFEVWLFIAPAILPRSRLLSLFSIPVATAFFVGGMAFTYYILLPSALPFLLTFMGFQTDLRLSSYFNFVTGLMFWMGIFFEFPLVVYFLARLKLIRAEMLTRYWRVAIVVISIIAAMITPTVDPINMSLVMAPMIIIYFSSILLAKFAQRGHSHQKSAA